MVGGEGRKGEVDFIYLSSSMRWALYVSLLYRCIKWRGALRIIGNIGHIYTTKIGTFVCPPHISETVAVRLLKFAHRLRIASTTKEIISKQILLSILSILF